MDQPDNDRPLRILHLTAHSEPGGLSRYIHDLSLAMHHQGHDVRVAGNRGAWHWLFESAPFPYIEVPLDKGPLQMWSASRTLRKYLRDHPVDILHSHYRRTTVVARRLQHASHPSILYTIHLSDIPIHWRARLWPDFGDHVHVASAEAKRWAIESAHVAPANITMIPHGIHADQFPVPDDQTKSAARRRFNINPDDRVAIFVGRLDSPKNEDWLLDVADRSRDSIPNLKILIAGKGPHEAELHHQIKSRKLESRVIPVGELKDPLAVYHAADALLLPSQREGFSLVTAEAMSAGVPVCRTRTAGSAELIIENETGRTTDIDRESFIRGAIDFLRDDAALRRMAANAPLHIRRHFTFERQLREMTALYRQLAGFNQIADTLDRPPAHASAQ